MENASSENSATLTGDDPLPALGVAAIGAQSSSSNAQILLSLSDRQGLSDDTTATTTSCRVESPSAPNNALAAIFAQTKQRVHCNSRIPDASPSQ